VAGASAQSTCPYLITSGSDLCFDSVYTCELCCTAGVATNGAACWVGEFVRANCCLPSNTVSTPTPTPPPPPGATPAPTPSPTPSPSVGDTPVVPSTPNPTAKPVPTPAPIYVCPYLKDTKLNCFDDKFYTCESCCQQGISTHGVSCWTFGFSQSECCKSGVEIQLESQQAGALQGPVCPYSNDETCWDQQYSCESCCLTGKSNGFSCWGNGYTESRCCSNAVVSFQSAPSKPGTYTPPPVKAPWANCPYNRDVECWGGIYDCNRCCVTGLTSLATTCWDRVYTPERCCLQYLAPATAVPQVQGPVASIADSNVQSLTCPYYAGNADCFSTLYTCQSCCTTGKDINGQFSCWDSQYNPNNCCRNSPTNTVVYNTYGPAIPIQPVAPPPPPAGLCTDTLPVCGIWAQIGECTGAASAYVRNACPSSCNSCSPGFRRSQPRAWGGEVDSRGLPLDSRGNAILPTRYVNEAGEPIDPRRPRAAQSDDDSSSAPLGLIIGLTSAAVACVAAVALVVVYQRRNTNGAHTPAVVEMDAVTNEQPQMMGEASSSAGAQC